MKTPRLTALLHSLAALAAAICLASCAEKFDVAVVGGGASGVAAAVEAERCGASVALVEETPWLGGMLTSAGVSCTDGNFRLRSGLFGEFVDSLSARYGSLEALHTGWVSRICFEPQIGETVFENMVSKCRGIRLFKQTVLESVEGGPGDWRLSIRGSNGKLRKVRAKVIIDATELGDVAASLGAEYRLGMDPKAETREEWAHSEGNSIVQDMTYVITLQDYGPDADVTIPEPSGYDRTAYLNSCLNPGNTPSDIKTALWSVDMMLSYGRLPGGLYMLNWPIFGNDFYANPVEMTRGQRDSTYSQAKNFALGFLYFIQTELGRKNFGIAPGIYPTADGLPLYPYFRESRRVKGENFLTLNEIKNPYRNNLYRCGAAVGDYPVDHHHYACPEYREKCLIDFPSVPSFNIPLGVMLPKGREGLLVAEKSISVSNLANGATRLQPVVMQLGQAAGVWAAMASREGKTLREIPVRAIQARLLEDGAYIMPYIDGYFDKGEISVEGSEKTSSASDPAGEPHFKAIQRIGATGILRGEGRSINWTNETRFRPNDPLKISELHLGDYYLLSENSLKALAADTEGQVKAKDFLSFILSLGEDREAVSSVKGAGNNSGKEADKGNLNTCAKAQIWAQCDLGEYAPESLITRGEAAALIDALLHPFDRPVDLNGNLK